MDFCFGALLYLAVGIGGSDVGDRVCCRFAGRCIAYMQLTNIWDFRVAVRSVTV